MNTIKQLEKLNTIIQSSYELGKLDQGAKLHLKNGNIAFTVLSVGDNDITVKAVQGRHLSKNYVDQKGLIEITKRLFKYFLPNGFDVKVQAVPHNEAPVESVTIDWVNKQMLDKGVRIKDMVKDTGIDKTNFSAWLSATNPRPMSQIVKSMFYYYFKSR